MNDRIQPCTKLDIKQINSEIIDFWGTDRTRYLHSTSFLRKNGESSWVIKNGDKVIAYLLGFIENKEKIGWVHLIGVRMKYHRQGLGRKLYEHFIKFAKNKGCEKIKAVTIPSNIESIQFHKKIGMRLLGIPNENGIPVIKNHLNSGDERVEFEMDLNY